ncbi:ABC transporter permease [Komagataeibacter sp. NFXK3]
MNTALARWRQRHDVTLPRLLGVLPVLLLVLVALCPGLFTPLDPLAGQTDERLMAPSATHWFGTDQFGRDVFSRIMHGSFSTLSAAVLAVAISLLVAIPLGLAAGLGGRRLSGAILAGADMVLAIPELFLSLSIITLIGPGATHVAFAVGISQVAGFTRMIRTEVVRVRATEYVEAAFGIGSTFWQVVWRHVVPNSLAPALSLATLRLGTAILAISTICFLGYGPSPPTPEWGLMITEGRNYLATAWWLTTFPGLAIIFSAWAATLLSRAIRMDP